jgi:SAM-dependent methyltransferase
VTAQHEYVHGYSGGERTRLVDQANTLTELLHGDTCYPPGSLVLEAGCGVGAQTVTLATRSARATILAVDISADSLAAARQRTNDAGIRNVVFQQADLYALPFRPESFDHVFVCFVLEHLARARETISGLKRALKRGGTMTVIEGDHGSVYFHPESRYARRAIECLIELQARAGGDSLIGRSLYPLLTHAGLEHVRVLPRVVYVDASRPDLVDGFTRKTFTAMVEAVGDRAIASGLIDEETWIQGIRDLYRTAEPDGTFCYAFFKAVACKPLSG